jgi:5'-AMP-activated protein kinase catalytic alpha subunit
VDQDSSVIDTDAVSEVCDKFGVQEKEVHNALLSGNPHDQLAIAYHLIIDNKRIADEAAKAELKDFYIAGSPPPVSMSPSPSPCDFGSSPLKPHPERIAPLRDRMASNQAASGDRGRGKSSAITVLIN